MEQYEQLTKRIGLMVGQGHSVNDANSPLQMLMIRRARILKQARGKVPSRRRDPPAGVSAWRPLARLLR